MPFKSKAQERFMFAKHPDLAKEWVKKYGQPEKLPEKVKAKKGAWASQNKEGN